MAAISITACFSSPQIEEHFYAFKRLPKSPKRGDGPSLLIGNVTSSLGYDTTRIAYRTSEHELRYYAYRQWIAEPGRMITEYIAKLFRSTGQFGHIDAGERIKNPDGILDAHLEAIEQIDGDNQWHARLAMTLRLKSGRSDTLLWEHSFDRTVPCAERQLERVVDAINTILTDELQSLEKRILRTLENDRPDDRDEND